MPSTDPSAATPPSPGGPPSARPGEGPKPPHQKEQEKNGPAQTKEGPRLCNPASGNGAATSGS